MKKMIVASALALALSPMANAADYVIDTAKAHASINFKVKHVGFSWLTGRFNTFDGTFSWDQENPEASVINVSIDTNSVDTNHGERNKHLRDKKILNVQEHPKATFSSTKVESVGKDNFKIHGDFTLNGVTKPLVIEAVKVGEGDDPWGGYRAGFAGSAAFEMADYNIERDFGTVVLDLHIEGIKQ